ncbi:Alpha/beta-Hydrolases superfamily protein [Rhynchospora pubera]|uniref:Alpha/beta-Hydrolases superfamily protein n=1 Tax=Rhynchospora pubera TaxID=906938 RepID=A0AAV8CFD1_9POAL|nr:Alpha/beta-Hydrolases superfamily protein [Rhynchospora pubera]
MERPALLKMTIFICLLTACNGREIKIKTGDNTTNFNHTLALILAEYASAVYTVDLSELFSWTCARCNNLTMGFEVIELVVDIQNCLQAFVGVAPDPNAIVIAIRGTQENSLWLNGQCLKGMHLLNLNSVQNWIEDFIWQELDLKLPDMPGAMVHRGLYGAYNNTSLRPAIVEAVDRIRESYGELPVMATGHSMGGALVAFAALDLVMNHGIDNVHLMTFGQPRIGNEAFASCFYKYIPNTFRIVHNRDIVAHLPPYYSFYWKSYHHFPREVWLHDDIEQICDDSGEDPSCSRSVWICSINDHKTYYGLSMEAEDWSTCRIIMDRSLPYQTDVAGNIILAKDAIGPSIVKPISQKAAAM